MKGGIPGRVDDGAWEGGVCVLLLPDCVSDWPEEQTSQQSKKFKLQKLTRARARDYDPFLQSMRATNKLKVELKVGEVVRMFS